MPAAIDDDAMAAILTDADLSLSVEFYGADTSTAEDFTGSTFAWTFAPEGRAKPLAADVHTLTSGAGEITLGATNVVSANKTQAAIAAWKPGWYREEIRRFFGTGQSEVLYVGRIPIAQGLSQLATMGGGAPIPGGVSGRQIFRDGNDVRVVMGQASGEAAVATIEANASHADRLLADADLTTVAADTTTTHADKLAADADATGAHSDRLAGDTDASGAHTDRLAADGDAAETAADRVDVDKRTSWITKTANYALAASDRVKADSTGGSFSLTLPLTPADGTEVAFTDPLGTWSTHPVTLLRNGASIFGVADDVSLDAAGSTFGLAYHAAANNWSFV